MRRKQDLDLFSRMLFDGCKAQNIDGISAISFPVKTAICGVRAGVILKATLKLWEPS